MGVLGEGKGSTLVHILVVILSLVAFGFSIAAERRRSTSHMTPVPDQSNATYCVYSSDVATGYGGPVYLTDSVKHAPHACTTRKGGAGGGCVRPNFGNKPAVRVEGFDCRDRQNCSIPALA